MCDAFPTVYPSMFDPPQLRTAFSSRLAVEVSPVVTGGAAPTASLDALESGPFEGNLPIDAFVTDDRQRQHIVSDVLRIGAKQSPALQGI
jgi:hypothetical protein